MSHAPLFQASRLWFSGVLGLLGLVPFALMRQHLAEDWARDYSAQVSAAILAAGAVAYVFAGERKIRLQEWVKTGIAFVGFAGFLIGVVLLQGSSFHGLFDSLIVGPSKLGSLFGFPLRSPNSLWSGGAALCLAMVVALWHRRLDRLRLQVAIAKGIYGILGTLVLVSDVKSQLCYLLPWAWLAVVRSQENPPSGPRETFGRAFVCLMAVWQGLQAYPVPGTQISIATLMLVLVFSLCLHDAIKVFASAPCANRYLRKPSLRMTLLAKVLIFTGLLYLFVVEWCTPLACWRSYVSVPPLNLPGARYLRLEESQSEDYRALTEYPEDAVRCLFGHSGFEQLVFLGGENAPNLLQHLRRVRATPRNSASTDPRGAAASQAPCNLNQRTRPAHGLVGRESGKITLGRFPAERMP